MNTADKCSKNTDFDPDAKEQQLRSESEQWDTSQPEDAKPDDIPNIDLEAYFTTGSDEDLTAAAEQLRVACEETGFFSITGHQVSSDDINDTFEQVRQFHALPIERKSQILMDRPDWPVGGMGYLPLKNRKLPARKTGNVNEAFIIKCDDTLGMEDNQWPDAAWLPEFRMQVEHYAHQMEALGTRHFANNNTGSESRYSIPFFFNANPHHVMSCIPSCCSDDNPARYPPISYARSQGVVQGE